MTRPAISSALFVGRGRSSTSLLRFLGGGQSPSWGTLTSEKEFGPSLNPCKVKARAAFISKVLFSSISLAVTWMTSSPLDWAAAFPFVWTAQLGANDRIGQHQNIVTWSLSMHQWILLTLTHVIDAVMESIVWVVAHLNSCLFKSVCCYSHWSVCSLLLHRSRYRKI